MNEPMLEINILQRKCNVISTYLLLHFGDVANVQLKKGIFSDEITVIPRFEGVDKIKISAANKDVSYKIVELINNGIELEGRRI